MRRFAKDASRNCAIMVPRRKLHIINMGSQSSFVSIPWPAWGGMHLKIEQCHAFRTMVLYIFLDAVASVRGEVKHCLLED